MDLRKNDFYDEHHNSFSGLRSQGAGRQFYYGDEDSVPHPLHELGLKNGTSDNESSSESNMAAEIAAMKLNVEHLFSRMENHYEENRKLKAELEAEIQKHKDVDAKLVNRLDTQDLINQEIFKKLSAIENGELETVPISSARLGDLVEYQGYGPEVVKALAYLEKKGTLYVKDLKRLEIQFHHDVEYTRYIRKLGKISGYSVKKDSSKRWYVEKVVKEDDL